MLNEPMAALAELLQAPAIPGQQDWFTRAVDVAQFILVPLLTLVLAFAWDTWKQVSAVSRKVFGDPHDRDDRGLVGLAQHLDRRVDRLDVDVDRLYERQQLHRSPIDRRASNA